MAQQSDAHPKALKPALESMTLLAAGVIVHDKTNDRFLLLQRSETAKFAQVRWISTDSIPTKFVDTTASALRQYLTGGTEVSLDGWS